MICVNSAGLAVDEVMKPFKFPDDAECLTFNVTVSLFGLGEGFEAYHTGSAFCSSTAPNPFSEASVSMTVSACRSKFLSTPSDETCFLTSVKAQSCSGPEEYAVSFLVRSFSGAGRVARRPEYLVR